MARVRKISPCLWFDGAAEQAAVFYTGLFPDSAVDRVIPYGRSGRGEPGTAMLVEFTLAGQRFLAVNGGPQYAITPAVSLHVACEDQAEIDRCWDRLLEDGGAPLPCGWLTDQFGVSWQILPAKLPDMLADADAARAERVTAALMEMMKIDLAALEAAYAG